MIDVTQVPKLRKSLEDFREMVAMDESELKQIENFMKARNISTPKRSIEKEFEESYDILARVRKILSEIDKIVDIMEKLEPITDPSDVDEKHEEVERAFASAWLYVNELCDSLTRNADLISGFMIGYLMCEGKHPSEIFDFWGGHRGSFMKERME